MPGRWRHQVYRLGAQFRTPFPLDSWLSTASGRPAPSERFDRADCHDKILLDLMAQKPSVTLGQYEVSSAIGAGEMGEVYRARDTKLGREVALKVLPNEVARDPERLSPSPRCQPCPEVIHPCAGRRVGDQLRPTERS